MALHNLVRIIDKEEAVHAFLKGESVISILDGESYYVDNFGIFDVEDATFCLVDYRRLDVISLIERMREQNDSLCEVATNLHSNAKFTNMLSTSSLI